MTLLSLAEGCRMLSIDAKTLRRWLAQAQLTLQPHPTDARITGLTCEQLLLLATAHHRSLPALPQELAAPACPRPPEEPPSLPPELLALLPTLTALPAQIAALQQQLAGLTQKLDQQHCLSAVTAPHSQARAARVLEPTRASASTKSPPAQARATKRLRPAAHVLPLVEYAAPGHYVGICPKHGLLSLQPDTPEWFTWLATLSSFRFVGKLGRLTAHREVERLPRAAWRAHRQICNHTYNVRLGATEGLMIAALEQAAAALQAHLK
jgi:hypothetical protein